MGVDEGVVASEEFGRLRRGDLERKAHHGVMAEGNGRLEGVSEVGVDDVCFGEAGSELVGVLAELPQLVREAGLLHLHDLLNARLGLWAKFAGYGGREMPHRGGQGLAGGGGVGRWGKSAHGAGACGEVVGVRAGGGEMRKDERFRRVGKSRRPNINKMGGGK